MILSELQLSCIILDYILNEVRPDVGVDFVLIKDTIWVEFFLS